MLDATTYPIVYQLPVPEQLEPGQVDPLEPPIDPNAPMALIPEGPRASVMPNMDDVEGFDVDKMTERDSFASNLDTFSAAGESKNRQTVILFHFCHEN